MMRPATSRKRAPAATSGLTSQTLSREQTSRGNGDLEDWQLAQLPVGLQRRRGAVHRGVLALLIVRGLELDHRPNLREAADLLAELPVEVDLVTGVALGRPDAPFGDH